ncbi:MAG: AMP-binding protein, partial [Deltaproteobacteria bacterium]|nr:AMP-binding protein [Deltaproteobacteria bacterium]
MDWFDYYHPDRPHITYYDEKDQKSVITYRDLKSNAEKLAAGLVKKGLKQGDSVAIMLPTGKEYFYSFFGILYSGGIPVPIYPPAKLSQIEDHLKRHAAILKNAGSPFLITVPEAQKFCYFLKAEVEELKTIVTFEELTEHQQEPTRSPARTDDTAFLQYTSGSTGNPKGVILSHRQLLANIRIMGKATRITSKDVFISWLPLYHDMGLIGAWLGSLYHACPLVILSPISFLLRPERWLKAIHQHRGSISAGPNFAYELCCQKIKDEDIEGIDLSSWRCAFNGAEQVSRETIDHFCERFKDYGFKSQSIMPVYGLAEASLGLTFPPHHSDVLIDEIDKEEFLNYGIAIKAAPDDPEKLSFVS